MPARKAIIYCGILVLVIAGSGLGLLNYPQVDAASAFALIASSTPTMTPSLPRNNGRGNSGLVNATPTLSGEFQTYTVQTGDNIYLIATKVYGTNSKYPLILAANNLNENSRLTVGMVLKIPALATPTATLTLMPTATIPLVPRATTPVQVPVPTQTTIPPIWDDSGTNAANDERTAIMIMLTTFATSTLIGATGVCGFLAVVIYSNTRRIARRQAMARRIRPPLVH